MAGTPWVSALRTARLRSGLTQEELAARAGLSVRTVRGVEQGEVKVPRGDTLRRLAAVVGLPDPELPEPGELRVGVLGPLLLSRGSTVLDSSAAMPRLLLGLLALRAGQLVSHGEITHALWGDRPPESRQSLVHTYLSRLRKQLPDGDRDRLVTLHGGYLFNPGPGQLDLAEFADGLDRAESLAGTDPVAALAEYEQALNRWRGPVLADLPGRLREHPVAVAVGRRRIEAALAYGELAVRLGRAEQAVRALRPLAAEHPLHEDLHAVLLLALAGSGRQAAALEVFTDIRDRLDADLGVRPSAALREAHLRVLRGEIPAAHSTFTTVVPAAVPRPAQLPPAIGGFTGRTAALAELDELRPGSEPVLLTGTAGVGKTALAVHWAHRVRAEFPDGQLYLNLLGHTPGQPLTPLAALDRLLRGLGVPAERVPAEVAAAADLYRSLVAERQLLVLLDNVFDDEQLRPLLAVGPGAQVVVTSRNRLAGVRAIVLDVLDDEEAGQLLAATVGAERLAAEPDAAAELINACARLPLALRITAANLAAHPAWPLSEMVGELLDGDRLSALEIGEHELSGVRATFDCSYLAQEPPARAVFRLLGLAPIAEFSAEAVAALAGCPLAEAADALARLSTAHLIRPAANDRITLHDLLREYAAERAALELTPAERTAAVLRLYGWYTQTVETASWALYGHWRQVPLAPTPPVPPAVSFADYRVATDWLDAEIGNITALIAHAAERGPRPATWRLMGVVRNYFLLRPSPACLPAAQATLAAAQAEGDPAGQVVALISLADAERYRERREQALELYQLALDRYAEAGLTAGAAAIHTDIGSYGLREQSLAAIKANELRILALHQAEQHDPISHLTTLNALFYVCHRLGEHEEALRHRDAAEELARHPAMPPHNPWVLYLLGSHARVLGQRELAERRLRHALAVTRQVRADWAQRYVLAELAELHMDTGNPREALELARESLELARRCADTIAEHHSLIVLGQAHTRLGQTDEALHCLRWARQHYRRDRNHYGEVDALLALSRAWSARDPRPARAYARAAAELARRIQDNFLVAEAGALLATLDPAGGCA
ncbi:BTAD domain-containing putative transcriptional regulator [Crossiella sp. CA-258035]|uniref:BTAD domain-containing putative transcriptional regulator n=1 Tax=Crossiella sp. CA-258035 TaxID=2981138 RepID=UPI0024BC9883|nr:BTAD domain-containing putative transcriptional regulator [Crossiella sp. CA-258035]WHT15896.1 BTAD domain-containing putative transcriptional regulator [Crossiella sp. CA-258035]